MPIVPDPDESISEDDEENRSSRLDDVEIKVDDDGPATTIVPALADWQPEAKYATWFYIAPDGKPHGPFAAPLMRMWFDQHYFDPFEMQLRHVQSMPADQFLPLPAFYPDITDAFFKPPQPPTTEFKDSFTEKAEVKATKKTQDLMKHVYEMPYKLPAAYVLFSLSVLLIVAGGMVIVM